MSKKGKARNKARGKRQGVSGNPARAKQTLPSPHQTTVVLLTEDLLEIATNEPHRLFALDPNDKPIPLYEAFPSAMGAAMLGALTNGLFNLVSLGEDPITLRRITNPDGQVVVEQVETGMVVPFTVAKNMTPQQVESIERRAKEAEDQWLRANG